MSRKPPALARLLLSLLPRAHRDYVAGDLDEEFFEVVCPERGLFRARLWYWGQVLRTLGAFVTRRPLSGVASAPAIGREVQHAYRGLRRRPGTTLVAVLTLSIGIGATAAVFSVADATLLRPVAGVERPDELVTVRLRDARNGRVYGFSLPNLRDLSAGAPAATSMAAYQRALFQVAADGLPARTAWAQAVTGDYFGLLGVHAARGRVFTPEEADAAEGPALAVVSDGFWHDALRADPGVVGRTLRINGTAFTVIGVTPPAFRGVERLDSLDLWVAGSWAPRLRHVRNMPNWSVDNRGLPFFSEALARLAPGRRPEELERQVGVALGRLVEAYPDENGELREASVVVRADLGLDERDRSSLGTTLGILTALVALVLLVTCANVANLLVLQGLRRRGENALRQALGASRGHLVLFHMAEALLLALPAALVGLGFAVVVDGALWGTGLLPEGVAKHVVVDGRVLLFAVGVATATAMVFGLVPSLLTSRQSARGSLQSGQRTSSRAATLIQGALSVTQLALSLALVGGALLLGRTAANLASVEVGFAPDQVLAFDFDPGPQGYDRRATARFQRDVLDDVRRLPGIEVASASGFPPFGQVTMYVSVHHPVDPSRALFVRADWVAEDFFDVLDVPLVAGRGIDRGEVSSDLSERPQATVLSRTLAVQLFGTPERAVGRELDAEAIGNVVAMVVVGVAEDIVDGDLRHEPHPKLYLPLTSTYQSFATLLVRTGRPPDAVETDVSGILSRLDPDVPLTHADLMSRRVARATVRERAFVRLSALLAAIAILLAGVGLYTVLAYAAAERRREFGIRIAIGASGGRVTRLVLGQALTFGSVGVIAGVGVAWIGSRLLAGVLYGVAPTDPVTLGTAGALLLVVALAASLTPVLYATRVDPVTALRSE